MDKKLPKIYYSSVKKRLDNTRIVYSSLDDTYMVVNKEKRLDVNEKINQLFKKSDFIYNIKAVVVFDDGEMECVLIGKTRNCIATLDDGYIKIKDIRDIIV